MFFYYLELGSRNFIKSLVPDFTSVRYNRFNNYVNKY